MENSDEPESLEERLERLEVRSAFQERLTQELSDQVYALHKVVAQLKAELEQLKKRAEEPEGGACLGPAFDPPPHY